MKKIIFFILACFFASSVLAENVPAPVSAEAENDPPPAPVYVPSEGLVEIPKLIILGQEEEGGEYYVKMQQTEGLNFEVTSATLAPDGADDSDEEPATYDPATGIVGIPLVIVFSEEVDVPLETFSVKMLKQEGEGLFFSVTEANPVEVKSKSKSSRVIQCWRSFVLKGRTRGIRRFFWRKDCPTGWHPA